MDISLGVEVEPIVTVSFKVQGSILSLSLYICVCVYMCDYIYIYIITSICQKIKVFCFS